MSTDRVAVVEAALDAALATLPTPRVPRRPEEELAPGLTVEGARELWVDMATSRALDVAARSLKAEGLGHYTISSAGHERTALVGAALRADDPALLHYRDGGLVMARHRVGGSTRRIDSTLASLVADHREPASGGRHKVWGSAPLWIVPQTSTIASHLPKATGMALAIDRAARLGWQTPVAHDAIVATSMGDASINHASALSGLNAAAYARRRGVGVPLLVVIEDNGLGISTPTPRGWVEAWARRWPHVTYVRVADDLPTAWTQVRATVDAVRAERSPAILHLPTVRLWGHAGSDVETGYRSLSEIRADEQRDPLVLAAHELATAGAADGVELARRLAEVRAAVAAARERLEPVQPLTSRAAVLRSLTEHEPDTVRDDHTTHVPADRTTLHAQLPEQVGQPARRTMAARINAALTEVMAGRPHAVVLGQDVGRKGGVYGVTAGLQDRFGPHRVIDTLLDETSILGAAQGAAMVGQLPIAEIQYLAYLHNAIDQLRGEAASTSFFSDGHFRVPMVVRAASFAAPQGFGGHFHNDHAVGALREIPGIAIAVPSRGDEAVRLLRTAVAMASAHGRLVAVLEPTALYHQRDLHDPGDDGWTSDWPADDELALPGEVAVSGPQQPDVLLVTAGNGVPLCHRVARRLEGEGRTATVLDIRWIAPLPVEAVAHAAQQASAVVVVDECRASGGWADAMVAGLVEHRTVPPITRVVAADSYVPIGPAAPLVLVSEDEVHTAATELLGGG